MDLTRDPPPLCNVYLFLYNTIFVIEHEYSLIVSKQLALLTETLKAIQAHNFFVIIIIIIFQKKNLRNNEWIMVENVSYIIKTLEYILQMLSFKGTFLLLIIIIMIFHVQPG